MTPAEELISLKSKGLFGPDGFLCTSVAGKGQKEMLSSQFSRTLDKFISAAQEGAPSDVMLKILKLELNTFDREALDT